MPVHNSNGLEIVEHDSEDIGISELDTFLISSKLVSVYDSSEVSCYGSERLLNFVLENDGRWEYKKFHKVVSNCLKIV